MVLVDMKFPECCFSCGLSHSAFYRCIGCSLTGKTITAELAEKMRMKDCPLVELPPHGRLIDADALIAKCGNWYTEEGSDIGFIGSVKGLLDEEAPTIIPADNALNTLAVLGQEDVW